MFHRFRIIQQKTAVVGSISYRNINDQITINEDHRIIVFLFYIKKNARFVIHSY